MTYKQLGVLWGSNVMYTAVVALSLLSATDDDRLSACDCTFSA